MSLGLVGRKVGMTRVFAGGWFIHSGNRGGCVEQSRHTNQDA
jgi:ribosomal protein L3